MARTKKRRIRSPHPGVVLLQRVLPSGTVTYQARYRDPDTGRVRKPLLDLTELSTHDRRREWAIDLSEHLAKRRMDLKRGAPKRTITPLGTAIDDFYKSAALRLRPATVSTYKLRIGRFRDWAAAVGVRLVEELTPAHLATFREVIIADGRKAVVRGGRRGQRAADEKVRAAATMNSFFTNAKTLLNHLRALGIAPLLSRDSISDSLKPLPVPHEQPGFLTQSQLDKLLRAASAHDAQCFIETRNEHARLRVPGTTRRYVPIAPFIAFLLLTGCRRGEALSLRWSDVDLDALDNQESKVGVIRLRATATKTHRARTIGLEVSPALRDLLAAMRERADGAERVFRFVDADGKEAPYTSDLVEAARRRLHAAPYDAPMFDYQLLRSTCATYLTNSPGIFGNATAFLSARQLGHSVAVAERHYLGVIRGISKSAHSLEAAMGVASAMNVIEMKQRLARAVLARTQPSWDVVQA